MSDEGLFRNYAEIIERVGDARLQIYLYHIPPVSQVPISLKLIERLLKAYPKNIAGTKDSSGDWNNTKATLDQFAKDGFDVFPGSETFLLAGMRNGGKKVSEEAAEKFARSLDDQRDLGRGGQTAAGPGPHTRHIPEISHDRGDEARNRALERPPRLGHGAPAVGGTRRRAVGGAARGIAGMRLLHARSEGLKPGAGTAYSTFAPFSTSNARRIERWQCDSSSQ